jgi:light-regulated signal transduction histidine kinase (bacteriophytochrome)
VARDITARKQAELALLHAKDSAEAANRELEAFSYSVAHDLRAPLRGMNGFAQLLQDVYGAQLDAEARDWLKEIQDNSKKMAGLIEALLSLSRLTRTELRREKVDLSALVRSVFARLTSRQAAGSIELIVEDGVEADADIHLLQSLLDNLLGNAIKFSSGSPAPRLRFGRTIAADGSRAFFIEDNGAGFDPAFSGKLFAPFQRLHRAHEYPGTGIGLATVQRIVHRHGGRIWAQAAVNRGATFYFTLGAD